jgi:hypothetical protein
MAYLRLTATKCHICHEAVSLEESDVDENGHALHSSCSTLKITGQLLFSEFEPSFASLFANLLVES